MQYTTLDLINSVKTRAMIPDASTSSFSPASILNLATEEFYIRLVPAIMAVREKYWETYKDAPIIANQIYYPIPTRAVGGIVTGIQYVTPSGIFQLQNTDPTAVDVTITGSVPTHYYIENNDVVLWPTINVTQNTLRIRYFQRPSRLEQTINCAQVISINALASTVNVSSAPSTWTTGTVVDFISGTVPYRPYALDTVLVGVSSGVISLSSTPSTLKVGDWLALSEYTPCIELPVEFQVVLAQAAATKVLEANGDQANVAISEQKLALYLTSALKLITPRDQAGTKKVTSNWRRW